MPDGTYAVIPVKPFASAKRRLAPILNRFERARLARLMLEDVLDAVRGAKSLSGIFVVSGHPDAAELGEAAGARVITEAGEFGFSGAIGIAQRRLARRGAKGVIVIPADIPHLPSATIDALVAKAARRGVALTPALYDGGTNLLAMRPCNVLPPLFGPDSFERHHRAALRAGIAPAVHFCPLAGQDIDRPADLELFLAAGSCTRSQAYLAGLGIPDRVAALRGEVCASCVPAPA
jgi:2-phospho-L-lactate guanylyltransferase